MEQTFVMIKPDGVRRNLVGEIISRFEKKGLKLSALKMLHVTKEMAYEHYREHEGKPFFEELVNYIMSGPVVAMVWEGNNAVQAARSIIGATNPMEADPGSIRGMFATNISQNTIHGADSIASAEREMKIYF
ncbi:MAG: nucleoside-diphosphate kinase [Bacillota bacterium]